MAVTQCPICKEFLVGYNWTKTPKGKNWLQHKENGWHSCPKNKFAKKTASSHGGKGGANGGLDLFPKWDSEDAGHYCTRGHLVSSGPTKDTHCPKCDVSLGTTFIEREHHE
jgi:hypothetical protein|tara:strand:+ start:1594 stop:1926 length:333 start_codon:yes stop_codon:yes gene_type:complete